MPIEVLVLKNARAAFAAAVGAFVLAFAAWPLAPAAQAFVLNPPERAATGGLGLHHPPAIIADLDDGPPEIVLVSPLSLKGVSSPLEFDLRFLVKPPRKIVVESIRVLYGFFGFDITDWLSREAEVTQAGILARNAKLPAGSHSITIEVSDDHNRVARRTFEIEVKDN